MTTESGEAPARAGRREWLGLLVLVLPTLLLSIDMSVLHLAVPKLTEDLRPGATELLWITDVYGFMVAGFLITMGAIGDRYGRRRLLLIGGAAFAVASVIAAYAPTAGALIVARALLGVAGATLMPSTLSLIRNMFHDPGQRTRAIGWWMTGFTGGMVLGPLVGGLLLEQFWWGSVFLLNVPVMVVLLVAGPLLLPEYKDPVPGRIDLVSVALSLAAVLPVIYGLKEAAAGGFGTAPLLAVLVGLVMAVGFVRRQRRLAEPLLDLALFAERRFSGSLGTLVLMTLVGPGMGLLTAQYLQLVVGLSPLEAGLWTTPPALAVIIGFAVTPWLARRLPVGPVMAGGLLVAVAGMVGLAFAGPESGPLPVAAALLLLFLGGAPLVVLGTDMVISAAPPARAGSASAMSESAQEFGAAFGLALFGSLATAVYRSRIAVPEGTPPGAAAAARDTLGGAADAVRGLPEGLGNALLAAARDAFSTGMSVAALAAAAILAVAAILAATLFRDVPSHTAPSHTAPSHTAPSHTAPSHTAPSPESASSEQEHIPAH